MLLLANDFCANTASIWGVLGWLVMAMKIVIPLLLIILGMVDLGKAVVSSDEKAINKAVNTLVKRFIAAIVVFFIPTIVIALFNAVTNAGIGNDTDTAKCLNCLLDINGHVNECKSTYSALNPAGN